MVKLATAPQEITADVVSYMSEDGEVYAVTRGHACLYPDTEGTWWARGHTGPEVDALRVATALADDRAA